MPKNEPEIVPDDVPTGPGKNRPTPTRAEREAANKRPLVANTKEARARARQDLNRRRDEARTGMANGEERYLLPRDKGPQRRYIRDFIDAGWHLGEFLMPLLVLVIVLSLTPIPMLQFWAFVGLWGYVFIVIFDMVITARRVRKRIRAKFGTPQRGNGFYSAMRSMQMRFMRLPKPQVARGQYPS